MAHAACTKAGLLGVVLSMSMLIGQDPPAHATNVGDGHTQMVVPTAESVHEVEVVAEFERRLQQYDGLRVRLHASLPVLMVSDEPETILDVVRAHNAALRSARYRAAQGDIFFKGVVDVFKARIDESLHGLSPREFLAMITETDAPRLARPSVNAAYPDGGVLTTMPPHLLQVLPPLPADLEYRFIDRDLILWDSHAGLIIDVIPNALSAENET